MGVLLCLYMTCAIIIKCIKGEENTQDILSKDLNLLQQTKQTNKFDLFMSLLIHAEYIANTSEKEHIEQKKHLKTFFSDMHHAGHQFSQSGLNYSKIMELVAILDKAQKEYAPSCSFTPGQDSKQNCEKEHTRRRTAIIRCNTSTFFKENGQKRPAMGKRSPISKLAAEKLSEHFSVTFTVIANKKLSLAIKVNTLFKKSDEQTCEPYTITFQIMPALFEDPTYEGKSRNEKRRLPPVSA